MFRKKLQIQSLKNQNKFLNKKNEFQDKYKH